MLSRYNQKKTAKTRIPIDPPRLSGQFFLRVVFRYIKTTTADATIFWRSLANLLIVSVSTTSGYVPYTSFRPKSLTCYAPAIDQNSAAGFAENTLSLAFYGGSPVEDSSSLTVTDRKFMSDTPTNARGCSIRAKFSKPNITYDVFGIVAVTSSPAVALIHGPLGTVVDLDMVIKLFGDDRTTLPKTSTTTGATSQVPYWNLLDNAGSTGAAGTGLLTPVNTMTANVNGVVWL
jgi:hypothetical protein